MKVRVLRPFWNGAQSECKKGSVVDLPEGLAKHAVASKKAEFVHESPVVSSAQENFGDPLRAAGSPEGGDIDGSKKSRK